MLDGWEKTSPVDLPTLGSEGGWTCFPSGSLWQTPNFSVSSPSVRWAPQDGFRKRILGNRGLNLKVKTQDKEGRRSDPENRATPVHGGEGTGPAEESRGGDLRAARNETGGTEATSCQRRISSLVGRGAGGRPRTSKATERGFGKEQLKGEPRSPNRSRTPIHLDLRSTSLSLEPFPNSLPVCPGARASASMNM